jgi:hypothetical protein
MGLLQNPMKRMPVDLPVFWLVPAISRAAKFRGKKIDQSERSKLTVKWPRPNSHQILIFAEIIL